MAVSVGGGSSHELVNSVTSRDATVDRKTILLGGEMSIAHQQAARNIVLASMVAAYSGGGEQFGYVEEIQHAQGELDW